MHTLIPRFAFDEEKFDLWPLYGVIKEHYPLGTFLDGPAPATAPESAKLEAAMAPLYNRRQYSKLLAEIMKNVRAAIKRRVYGTTYGYSPSISICAVLATQRTGNLTRTKELHMSVSLIGPYYTIVGFDHSVITWPEEKVAVTNCMVVSPFAEYEDGFRALMRAAESTYPGFRFVPYYIYCMEIAGLRVRMSDGEHNKVYHALFHLYPDITAAPVGDKAFGLESWIRAGYADTGERWVSYPPAPPFPEPTADRNPQ
ncbi:hypothetical protein [Flaviaesturariibacter amylovorans]|uniref:Uncharacterized protein n=1 Tax=Flaviaesturariibacter amylovorans TaxID=1084520 RepID=A0ABP8GJ42_9BACT